MKSSIIAATILLSGILAQASLIPDQYRNLNQNQNFRKDVVYQCENFNGRYEGTCNNDGQKQTIEITQSGCQTVVINGDTYEIGKIKAESKMFNEDIVFAETSAVNWSSDASSLILTDFSHTAVNERSALPLMFVANVSKQGEGLLIQARIWDHEMTCQYSRK